MSKIETQKSVSIRALCLAILCFHAHSGFERIFNNFVLLPLPEMGCGGAHSAPRVEPSRAFGAVEPRRTTTFIFMNIVAIPI
jgi:hypothetical protein